MGTSILVRSSPNSLSSIGTQQQIAQKRRPSETAGRGKLRGQRGPMACGRAPTGPTVDYLCVNPDLGLLPIRSFLLPLSSLPSHTVDKKQKNLLSPPTTKRKTGSEEKNKSSNGEDGEDKRNSKDGRERERRLL